MSPRPTNRSADLRKLREEGYEVEIREAHVLVRHVPYVTASKEVKFGTLVSTLTLAGGETARPDTHVINFIGAFPCHRDGSPIEQLRHQSGEQVLAPGIVVDHSFSNKPPQGYTDYYEKVTTYVRIISSPAEALEVSATARTFAAPGEDEDDPVFEYADTNSSRAEITAISAKLRGLAVAIVGLGGTGAYVLDQVAKTPVREIHLFDGDTHQNHNAFRAPGAASRDDLQQTPFKTDYFKAIYSRMHKRIQTHPVLIDGDNVDLLSSMDFVFVCVDKGDARRLIFDRLEASRVSFIDVGMGVHAVDGKLRGIVRATCSTPTMRGHVQGRVPFDQGVEGEYGTNIQIADLNMLNAALAVIKWKKIYGVYDDLGNEHHSTYTIDVNMLLSDAGEA
jgi:hypothetical protein